MTWKPGSFYLRSELETVAQANEIKAYYKSARTLAQKIRSPHIARDFDVEITVKDARKVYRIWRKTDTKLTSVPADGAQSSARSSARDDDEDEDEGVKFI